MKIEAQVTHSDLANAIRFLAADSVEKAKSGHPGMPMGMADAATVLFGRFLKFDAADPAWPDRDRFVLSAGHGSMLLYSLLYLTGGGLGIEDLKSFRQWGSKTPGHPEYGHTPGVETTTGPLGQGIATAVGMALAEKLSAHRFGPELVDHYTYVIAGDGCLMEGLSHEAISLAGHLHLGKLIVLWDDNHISIDGDTALSCSDDQLARFAASGWSVRRVDGHDPVALTQAIDEERHTLQPSLIACRTLIGYGSPGRQGSEKAHGAPLGEEELVATRAALGWDAAPFEVPNSILAAWRAIGSSGAEERKAWIERLEDSHPDLRDSFADFHAPHLGEAYQAAMKGLLARFSADKPKLATRQSSQKVLEAIVPALPRLIGGSADLTHSNLTAVKTSVSVRPGDFAGNYIHYGIREHGMAAAMNGLALHGGFIPYGGTFLAFSDYSRPAIRLAALMGARVVHVMTHDSIGLGEDGPTHQPVEQIPALRLIPNLLVFRPADAVETAESWDCALSQSKRPSVLCLSRQALPAVRGDCGNNLTARGAYVLREAKRRREVTLIATGSEVSLALAACDQLAEEGIAAAVVSAPCFELFAEQAPAYRSAVLGTAPRIGIEAAVEGNWPRWLGDRGRFIGMTGFGASAPAETLYQAFGITVAAVVEAAFDATQR